MRCICHACAEQVKPQVPTKNHVPQRALRTAGRDSIKLQNISKPPKLKEAAATQPDTATSTPLVHNYTACKHLPEHPYQTYPAKNMDSPKQPTI